jgi:uncharacterized SAM-binding protein YcdF (DUF218 family)
MASSKVRSVPNQQPSRSSHLRKKVFGSGLLLGVLIFGVIGYRHLGTYLYPPEAVLVLGGETTREQFAAQFAQQHPRLPIWISSGANPEYAEWVFEKAAINPSRLHLDYRALDTVTNFTTLADEFKARGIRSIFLITSDDHMRRAAVVGEIVLGSRGIYMRPISFPSGRSPEPIEKVIRDGARAMLWVFTGRTGITLRRWLPRTATAPDYEGH